MFGRPGSPTFTWGLATPERTSCWTFCRGTGPGTRVTCVPGNHDESARACPGMRFGNILVERTACHTLLDGRRLLGKPYRSLSAYLRNRTKSAVRYMASLEVLLAVTAIPEEEGTGGDGYAGRRSELVL